MKSPRPVFIALSVAFLVVLTSMSAAQLRPFDNEPPDSRTSRERFAPAVVDAGPGAAATQAAGAEYQAVAKPGTEAVPLEQLVRPDGTLELESGFRGSVSMTGWRMDIGADGAPSFEREGSGEAKWPGGARVSVTSAAGDTNWDGRFGLPLNSGVSALALDGNGNLYAGGGFTRAGGDTVNHIAKWNGRSWSALGSGMNNAVLALAMDGSGNLYAGGAFTTAGGDSAHYTARWDGSSWSALGAGMGMGAGHRVATLAMDASGNLYAAGVFTTAGGDTVNNIAKWNGSSWSALGAGVNSYVYTLAADGSGSVYAGGLFTMAGGESVHYVAKWNGSSWSALGAGMNSYVYALAVDGSGNLYAGGRFDTAGGESAIRVAMWDGSSWSALGAGMNVGGAVTSLTVDASGNLYAGGTFVTAGGVSAKSIAKWDGTSWSALGAGLYRDYGADVQALVWDGSANLYAGGSFDTAGEVTALGVAKWDGTSWSALGLGMNHDVRALAVDGSGNLYAGGYFWLAGAASAYSVAEWNGTSWSALGIGMPGENDWVYALAVDGSGNLYAGGHFTAAGGVSANHIAMWNGTSWSALGEGMNGEVRALAVDGSGILYAGGYFTTAGGVSANYVAKWNGTSWSALGGGMNQLVFALAVDASGNLYAGGDFLYAGGESVNHVAKWDGSSWSALGEGTNLRVWALAVEGSENLYAGGSFTQAGGESANYIAKWNGSSWSALGSGVNSIVRALAVDLSRNLYVGGDFNAAGGVSANSIAKWNGTSWSALGSGVYPFSVYALAVDTDWSLYTGGSFTAAGGNPSSRFGIWHIPTFTVTATAGANGAINPGGAVIVSDGGSQTFECLANAGYFVSDVLIDGESVGAVTNYTFTNVQADHTIAASFSIVTFDDIVAGLAGVNHSSVAWGDYDNDGDLDILLSGLMESAPISRVYRNEGAGVFADINADLPGVWVGSVAWGDYDNDGRLDILLSGYTDTLEGLSRVYRNEGAGVFTDIDAGLPGVAKSAAAWGDCDNDGDLDILLSGLMGSAPISRVYRNEGAGVFTDIDAGLPGVNAGSVAWGDHDNDGDLDILLTGNTGEAEGISCVYRNDGSGAFIDIVAGLPGVSGSSAAWGDYDNDGDLDILLAGHVDSGDYIAMVFRNDAGGFTDIAAGLLGVVAGSATWGDFENDGDLDILVTGTSSSGAVARLFRNNGPGPSTDINTGLPGVSGGSAAWGDYDDDGDLDILLTGASGSGAVSRVYRCDGASPNTPPTSPTGLSIRPATGGIALCWSAATDVRTPTTGLSYNLRVGTTQGGVEIRSPMSASTGYRRIVALGNARPVTTQPLALQEGQTYYWSVQALDTAFRGSAFAPEASFTYYDEPTPQGSGVQVVLGPVNLEFGDVSLAGTTTLGLQSGGPEVPAGLRTVPEEPPTYYHIETTAAWTGSVGICIAYDPAHVQGNETDLHLMHYVGTPGYWEEVTAVVDVEQHRICGSVASLSPFVVAEWDPTDAETTPLPQRTCLHQNTPNPLNPTTTIRYDLVRAEPVRLVIHDVRGRLVRVLVNEAFVAAGRHAVTWNGHDASGGRAASGVYVYTLRTPTFVQSKRLVLLK